MAYPVLTEDLSRVNGIITGCGEASALMAVMALTGKRFSTNDLTGIIQKMNQLGLAGNWGTGPDGLAWLLKDEGVADFQHAPASSWRQTLDANAGKYPVILNVWTAGNGFPEDRGVQHHYVTVFGKNPDGSYIVGDPNTRESQQGQTVNYTPEQIGAATPVDLIVVKGPGGNGMGALGSSPSSIASPFANPVLGPILGGPLTPALQALAGGLPSWAQPFTRIISWFTNPLRLFKLFVGVTLITSGFFLFVLWKEEPNIKAAAAAASGDPAVAQAIQAKSAQQKAASVRRVQQRQSADRTAQHERMQRTPPAAPASPRRARRAARRAKHQRTVTPKAPAAPKEEAAYIDGHKGYIRDGKFVRAD